ncbi:MAG: hypothetical protein NVS1B1_00010 [Candidatus Limnocylindrales bacterium]
MLADLHAAIERRIRDERERGFSMFAVEAKGTGTLIGQAGLQPVERVGPEIELAYHLGPAAWNKGYATEAAVACLKVGFAAGLERIIAISFPENVGSWRVMEKAGMRFDGDAAYYGITGLRKYVVDRGTWAGAVQGPPG